MRTGNALKSSFVGQAALAVECHRETDAIFCKKYKNSKLSIHSCVSTRRNRFCEKNRFAHHNEECHPSFAVKRLFLLLLSLQFTPPAGKTNRFVQKRDFSKPKKNH